ACDGTVAGASFTEAWKSFSAWSPPTNTPEGAGVEVQPASDVSVTFTSVVSRGSTQATASASGPPPPPGLLRLASSPSYDVPTTAEFVGPVDVCIAFAPADYAGLAPRLFHLADGAWSDVTSRPDGPSRICGRVTSLSPFAVFGDEPPTVSVPDDLAVDATAPG